MSGQVQSRPAAKADAGVDGTHALRPAARCGQAPEPRSGAPQAQGLRAARLAALNWRGPSSHSDRTLSGRSNTHFHTSSARTGVISLPCCGGGVFPEATVFSTCSAPSASTGWGRSGQAVRSDLIGGLSPRWDQTYLRSRATPSLAGPASARQGSRTAVQATPACFVQWKGSPDRHIACIVQAKRRAKATLVRRAPRAFASRTAQAFRADQRPRVIIAFAAT